MVLNDPVRSVYAMAAQPHVQPLTDEELARQGLKVPGKGQIRSFAPTQLPKGVVLTAPEKWPPPGCDMNELDDDDIAGALRFAIPDFRAEEKQLPDIDKGRPELRPFQSLCEKFGQLFSLRPGQCDKVQHRVNTHDDTPVVERVRPVPHKWREDIEAQLREMEELGVIRRSTSAWRFPCVYVYVPKKNGKVRMCVDYRKLNQACHTEAYPVPRPDDVQEHLSHAKVFSTLDLRSGYWQLPVRPEDQHKTAFCPGPGFPLYEWCRMPFGLASAPATFQRLMDMVLGHLPYVRVYLDDVLVFSRSHEEHLRHLEEVFRLLEEANLTIAGDKCEIARSEVGYLGHVFNEKGMTPDAAKVEAVLRWPVPTTASELRSFIGLAGYYRHFVSHFSSVVRPLYALESACKKEKNNSLVDKWGEEHDAAFLYLKSSLAALPALAYPDFEQPFQLVTDASDYAIGAVLEQQGRPLAFYSQALSGAQLRWPVYEKEAYAIFKALDHFRTFFLGYPLDL
ncbi:hypothetical protein FOZ62_007267, partial [Perkinsus olseni]